MSRSLTRRFPTITLILLVTVVVVFTVMVVSASSQQQQQQDASNNNGHQENEEEEFTIEVPLDLPPLPQHVMQWSVEDVERWMNITIGYPEYSAVIREHLIDGPTLLLLNMEATFFPSSSSSQQEEKEKAAAPGGGDVATTIHIAKLRAHQQLLRGQCLCPKRDKKNYRDQTLWDYFDYSSRSTLFHMTFSLFAPRLSFFSLWYFDSPLMCCAFGSGTTTSTTAGSAAVIDDAAVAAQLAQMQAGRLSSYSGGESSPHLPLDQIAPAAATSPCGFTAESCASVPSWILTIFSMLMPYSVMAVYAIPSWTTHPFLASIFILGFIAAQVTEVFYAIDYFMLWREQGSPERPQDTMKRVLQSFLVPLFLLVPLSFLIGWFLPHWTSYLMVLGLVFLNGMFVVKMVLNLLGEMLASGKQSPQEEEEQQQQQQQQQQGFYGSHSRGRGASHHDVD